MQHVCSVCRCTPCSLCDACVLQTVKAHRSQIRGVQNAASTAAKGAAHHAYEHGAGRARSETHARFARACQELESRLEEEHAKQIEARSRIEAARARVRQRRANLQQARLELSAATDETASPPTSVFAAHRQDLAALQILWDEVAVQVAHARQVLVVEAIATFAPEVKQMAIPSKTLKSRFVLPKTRLHHRIAGCALPAFPELKAACSSRTLPQTNAAVSNLAHCIVLVASYLGLILPFAVTLGASASVCGSSASVWSHRYNSPHSLEYDPSKKADNTSPSFTGFVTAYTMLVYNVAYMSHSQGLPVEAAKCNEVVPALLALAQLPTQIKPSDALAYHPVPDDLASFVALDFKQLLDSNLASATSSKSLMMDKIEFGEDQEEDWRVVKYG